MSTPNIIQKLPNYEANRTVVIKSRRVAYIYWGLIVSLTGYSLFFFFWDQDYMDKYKIDGTVTITLIGSGTTTVSVPGASSYTKIQDAVDLRYPAAETNAITIMTNIAAVNSQNRLQEDGKTYVPNVCPSGIMCSSDADCKGQTSSIGRIQDVCTTSLSCQQQGWCNAIFGSPENIDGLDTNVILKLSINAFFKEKEKQHNILELKLGDILAASGFSYSQVQASGGLFLFRIKYDCTINERESCTPTYEVLRLDTASTEEQGYTVYAANYSKPKDAIDDNTDFYYRDLKLIKGVRFVFSIGGNISEFSLSKLILGIGAAMGLVGLAEIIVDALLGNYLEEGKVYEKKISVDLKAEKEELNNLCREVVLEVIEEFKIDRKCLLIGNIEPEDDKISKW